MATINEMRQDATQIENETQVGGNTASRVGGLFNDIVDKLEDDETDINIVKRVEITYKQCQIPNKYINDANVGSALSLQSNNDYGVFYFFVRKGQSFAISSTYVAPSASRLYIFHLDEDLDIVQRYENVVIGTTTYTATEDCIVVGTLYGNDSVQYTGIQKAYLVNGKMNEVGLTGANIIQHLKDLEADIDNDITNLNTEVGSLEDEVFGTPSVSNLPLPNDGVLNANGTISLYEDWYNSDYFAVDSAKQYTYNGSIYGGGNILYYDSAKNLLGACANIPVNYADRTNPVELNDMPSNAAYIRVSGYDISACSITESDSLRPKVENIEERIDNLMKPQGIIEPVFGATLANPVRIKLLGDSITQGWGGSNFDQDGAEIYPLGEVWQTHRNLHGYCWANMMRDYLETKYHCTVVNNAITGTSTRNIVTRLDDFIDAADDIVICAYGTNNRNNYDGNNTEWNSFVPDLFTIVNYCKERNKTIILVANIPASSANEQSTDNGHAKSAHMNDVHDAVLYVAESTGVECVDMYDAFNDYCINTNTPLGVLLGDGLHPNDNGYDVYYSLIMPRIGVAIESAAESGGVIDAGNIKYDNSQSGLANDDVQGALDELSQDISNEVADLLTQANKTKSNGTIDTENNKWKTTSDYYGYWYKIDTFRGKKLTINTSVNGINAIAFTTVIETTNGSPMDYAAGNIMEIIPSNNTRTYTIPSDANYIFVLTYGNGVDRTPRALKVYESIQDTLDSLGGLKKDITSEINISVGGFYDYLGVWRDSANWSSSDLIPTDDIELLYVSSAVNSHLLQVVFFDAAGQVMLSSSVLGSGDASVASPNIVKVPSGVKYAMVSGKTSESIPISVIAVYDKPSYVVDIEDSIEILAKDDVTVPANNHGFYLANYNTWVSADRWSSTDMICVDGYDYVRNTSVVNDQAYSIAFIDGKGKVIGGIAGSTSTLDNMETIETEIPSNAKYVIMTGFTADGDSVTSELLKRNGSEEDNPIADMKKITLVLIYGQSLSVGADSVPISTTPEYNNLLMLNTGLITRPQTSAITSLVPMVENTWETPASGTGEMFVEALQKENAFGSYQIEWNGHDLVFACPGVGSASIDDLTATSYYQYVENIITAVKNICDAHGYTLDIPAWCWVQGEQDTKTSMSASDYKTKLLALQNKFCNSVSTITGITERPKCIIYQPSCQNIFDPTAEYNYAYDHMGVPTAFMELLRDNSEFVASSPTYIFDPSNSGGVWVHLNEQSYKLLGAYQGYALKRLIIDGERNQGVVPLNISVDGNTITIKYNVPCPPLRFDTEYVNAAPNMGFNVIKSDNTELISSVSVFNDTVTIVCSSSPSGAKLRYGMNGTYHEFISGQYHYYSGAGRVIGARGNLRDDQGCYVYKDIQGYKYPMYNWAYTFEKVLD